MQKRNALLIVFLLFLSANAYPQQRTLEISGLRNYTEDELFDNLNLQRYEDGSMSAKEVVDTIVSYYNGLGYTLVKVYVIENTEKSLEIYVDEGVLGKIIFLHMDDFTLIYLKVAFRLKNKIFNIKTVTENIEKLKKGKRWKDITYELKPVKEYDTSLFQLDRELNLPLIGKKQLPIFDKFPPRYDMVVIFSKSDIPESIDDKIPDSGDNRKSDSGATDDKKDKQGKKKRILNKFDYGLRLNFYKGFIPYMKYYQLGLLSRKDFLMAETSLGVMYGIDSKFTRPPRITYYDFNTIYYFPPTFKDIFTPHLNFNLLYSQAARPDLGLEEYNFLVLNGLLAPGITLLSKFNIYTGFGVETAFQFQNKVSNLHLLQTAIQFKSLSIDPYPLFSGEIRQADIQNYENLMKDKFGNKDYVRTDVYNYIEAGIKYDFSKKGDSIYELRKNRLKKEIAFAYDFYFLEKTFNKIRVIGYYDHEFKDRSIYSGALTYQFTFYNPPFYHEGSVSGPAFKGFYGLSYFSKNVLAQSNEYRVSVYRDFLYIGVYFDMTVFDGSRRDLTGAQFGFVGGPTIRVLLLDHFELYLQYGWDYLLATNKSHGYLYFNIYNKW
jgi:hypothetical protein